MRAWSPVVPAAGRDLGHAVSGPTRPAIRPSTRPAPGGAGRLPNGVAGLAPMVDPLALVPSEGIGLADVDRVLTTTLGLTRQGSGHLSRTFYDTFDGRLAQAGLVAEHEHLDDRRWLRVRRIGATAALAQAVCDRVEGAVGTLADRRVRDALAGPAGDRALLAIVRNDGEVHRFGLLDELDKTIVRISVVASSARAAPGPGVPRRAGAPAAATQVLDPVITISPVRGHERAFAAVADGVALHLGERPAADPLRRAAAAAQVSLGTDPSDRGVPLDAGEPAAVACARVLQHAADVLEANVEGVVARADTEFLHDLRVTLRATRAVVRAARGVLEADTAPRSPPGSGR